MTEIKTCRNCSYYNVWRETCLRSDWETGNTKILELGCDVNFSGWKEMPKVEIKEPSKEEIETFSSGWKIVKRKSWIRRVLGL